MSIVPKYALTPGNGNYPLQTTAGDVLWQDLVSLSAWDPIKVGYFPWFSVVLLFSFSPYWDMLNRTPITATQLEIDICEECHSHPLQKNHQLQYIRPSTSIKNYLWDDSVWIYLIISQEKILFIIN